jgi:hypothetical protein
MHRLAIVVAISAMALGACSGGGSKADPPASPPTSTRSTTSTGAPGTPITGITPTTQAPSGPFSSLVDKAKTANIKITYQTAKGTTLTIAQNGIGNSAFISQGILIVADGPNTVTCTGITAAATCTDLGSAGGPEIAGITSAYAGLSSLNQIDVGHTTAQTIAGRSASCVTFKAADYAAALATLQDANKLTPAATVTACVDDDSGFALKIALSDRGQTVNELVATQVGTPSPSDFVPPSTPVTIPGLGTTVPAG